jgi:hypothetical protein
VVECVAPYTGGSTHGEWEPILLDNGYTMTLFDGLNRFYVAAGEDDLAEALRAPASVVDLYETAPVRELNVAFHQLNRDARAAADAHAKELAALHARLSEVSHQLAENVERQRALSIELDRRQIDLDHALARAAKLEESLSHVERHEAALLQALTAMEQSKLFRYSRLLRNLYSKLRGRGRR